MKGHDRTLIACTIAAAFWLSAAQAETLIYVTPTQYGAVDSATPNIDRTPGGPVSYSLPGGYLTVGADVGNDTHLLYLLGRNGSNCQLFATDPSSEDNAIVAKDSAYACAATPGDFDLLSQTGNSDYEYLLAQLENVIDVIHEGTGQFSHTALPVTRYDNSSTGAAQLTSIAVATTANDRIYGVESERLVQLQPVFDRNGNPTRLQPVGNVGLALTSQTPQSLDSSSTSGRLYLLNGNELLLVDAGNGFLSKLGTVPAGTVSVVAAGALVENDSAVVNTDKGPLTLQTSDGRISTFKPVSTPDQSSPEYNYPVGFYDYQITGLTPGQSVRLTFTLPDGANDPTHYIKCDDHNCKTLPDTHVELDGRRITITLTDGGVGDADGVADGVINDPGAPATLKGSSSGGSSNGNNAGTQTRISRSAGFGWLSLLGLISGFIARRLSSQSTH